MLWLAHDGKLRQVVPASDDVSDGRPAPRAESKQGLERCHGCLAPIMTKDELVEINLQLMSANAVVRSEEPLLKIPDGTIGERHRRLGPLAEILSRWLHARDMSIACLTQAGKLLQAISVDRRVWRDGLLDECQQRRRLEIGAYRHPCAAGPGSTLLDGNDHERCFSPFQLAASPQPLLWTSHPRVVQFDLAVQGLARHVDHGAPELMQEQPSRFIPTDRQLSLEQQRGNPPFVRGHQISGPKPQGQRGSRPVEHRARCHRCLVVASRAFPPVPRLQWKGLRMPATRTSEPISPPTILEILPACRFVAELALELMRIARKRGTRHGRTLLIVVT